MKTIDLAEQTRLLGLVPGELRDLRAEIDGVRAGAIDRPVREIAPIAVRIHQLSIRCLQQLDTLSTSQCAVIEHGPEFLARLSGAALRISVAASLCTYGITGRTDALVYVDGDRTAGASRGYLSAAGEELVRAAGAYRRLSQYLSRQLASAVARAEDQPLIDRAISERPPTASKVAATPSVPTARARRP